MNAIRMGLRPERSLVIGLGCLLGAYLFQVQRYTWGWGTIPGRGAAFWVLVGLFVGMGWGWKRPVYRCVWVVLLAVLSSPPWLHEVLRREWIGRWWLDGASVVLIGSAGWAFAMPFRALVQIDLRKEERVALGTLLGDILLLATILAILPYFGVLPTAAALGVTLWFWLWRACPSMLLAYSCFFPALACGLMPWSSGVFLSIAGTWPVEHRVIDGRSFYLERDRRVPLFRMVGPGGEVLSADQHRMAEAMIAPWFEDIRGPARIMLVGGEDGILLRELLSSPAVVRVDLWSVRAARLAFFANHPITRRFHQDAFRDPRVFVHIQPTPAALVVALERAAPKEYAAILQAVDPPAHRSDRWLYQPSVFRTLRRHLQPQGPLIVAAGNWEDPDDIACVGHALRWAGFFTQPYRASGMDITWSFWWASTKRPSPRLVRIPAGLRSIRQARWPGMITFPRLFDPRRAPLPECTPPSVSPSMPPAVPPSMLPSMLPAVSPSSRPINHKAVPPIQPHQQRPNNGEKQPSAPRKTLLPFRQSM